jgi:RNA recognition motif-containing protein
MSLEPEAIRNLMVNYIPTVLDEGQLRQLFEMYGPIESVRIICDRDTRESRGYGFVKYRASFSAVNAIQYLNGYPILNKRLKVAYANVVEAERCTRPDSGYNPMVALQLMHYYITGECGESQVL